MPTAYEGTCVTTVNFGMLRPLARGTRLATDYPEATKRRAKAAACDANNYDFMTWASSTRGGIGREAAAWFSIRCTPVQHSAAWWAACWCCARCLRGGFGAVLPAEASGARHARRRAWPGWRMRARSMSQPARRERRASWHIVCMLPSILWSTAVNLTIVDQNRRAL